MTPRKLLQAAVWAVIRCVALSALVSTHQMAQQLPPPPTAESVAAKIKLSGVVRSAQGVPIPGATVDLVQTQTGQHLVTWTDESGKFELAGMPIGHYRYTVDQLGFERYTTEADVSVDTKPIMLPLTIKSAATLAADAAPPAEPAKPATEKAEAAKPAETAKTEVTTKTET